MAKSAYTYDGAAAKVGLSGRAIEREVAGHRLVAFYYGAKPIALRTELLRWLGAPHRAGVVSGGRTEQRTD